MSTSVGIETRGTAELHHVVESNQSAMLCTIRVTRLFPNHVQPAWDFTMSTTHLHLRPLPPITLGRRALAQLALFCLAAAPIPVRAEVNPAATAPIQRLCDALIGVMRAGTAVPFAQ